MYFFVFEKRWFEYAVSILAAVFLLVLTVNNVAGYSIEGDCVVQEGAYYKVSQCPHTLNDFTNYPNVTVWNKDSSSHNIDIAFGFDTSNARPTQAWLWKLNVSHEIPIYGNVSHSYTCVSPNNFSYQLTPYKYFWCNSTNGSVVFEHYFVNGWLANKTAEWFEWEQNGTEIRYWDDWIDVSGVFNQISWNNKTWFYRENVAFAANETKILKMKVEVKPNSNGKYDLFAKLSSDSFQEAFDSGRYVLLDPWFNTSWFNRKCVNVTDGWNTDRLNYPITVNVTGLTLATSNCSKEIRVLANYSTDTALVFGGGYDIINASGQTASSGHQWCDMLVFVNQTATANATYTSRNVSSYCFYYNNAAAATPSYTAHVDKGNEGYWTDFSADIPWGGGAGLTKTVSTVNENRILNTIAAGSADPSFFYLTATNNFTAGALGITQIWRVKYNNGSTTGYFGYSFGDGSSSAAIGIRSNLVKQITDWDTEATANAGSVTLNDGFHTIVDVTNKTDYYLYVDGVLITSGINGTHGYVTKDYLQIGGAFVSTFNFDLDYWRVTGGMKPPLATTLGVEEALNSDRFFNATCKDETTDAFLQCNIAVSNSTTAYSESNVWALNYSNSTASRPFGALTLTANKTGYSTRSIPTFFFVNGDTNVNVTIYLLNNSISTVHAIAVFTVTSAYGTVAGADVNLSKMVGGSPVLVASGVTDGFGTTSFFVDSTSSYQLSAFKTGYGGALILLTNPLLTTYTIILGSGVNTSLPITCLTGISTALTPNSRQLFRGNQTITWSISSVTSNLSYWGWRVDWNGTIVNTSNYTVSSGGVTNYLMDFVSSNASGLVGVQYFWNIGGYADCVRNDVFFVNNMTGNTGLLGMLTALKTDTGIGDNALSLLALIIITSMVVFASRYTTVGGAAIGIITLAFFTFITGWINPVFFLVLAIGGIAWTYFAYERGF